MKNIFIDCNCSAIICRMQNENGKFTVTGKIKNAPADSVYLEKLSYNSADSKTIDSAKIDKDGSYKLSGADTQQNLYMLSFKNSPAVILVNDAGKINIDFDLKGAVYPDINGSAATKELYDFLKDFWQKDSLLSDNYYKLDSMNKNGIKDSVYAMQLQQQYVKQIGALGSAIQGFVKKSNNPAAICFVLDKARGAVSPDDLNALVQDASKRFPEHSGIAIFKSEIAQAMQSQSQANSAASALLNQPAPDLTMTDAKWKKNQHQRFQREIFTGRFLGKLVRTVQAGKS